MNNSFLKILKKNFTFSFKAFFPKNANQCQKFSDFL